MRFIFHPEAEDEFDEAIDYYEQCETGLGEDFGFEVYAAIQNILSYPKSWPVLDGEVRRCLTNRFPYGIIYSIEPEGIFILAVMHLHRSPDYWKERR
jgi:plasmid stabilization system protein ParE